MTALWATDGTRIPVTVLEVRFLPPPSLSHQLDSLTSLSSGTQLDAVQVISSQSYPAPTPKHRVRHTVIVGCSPRKAKTTHNALLGQFKKAGVEPKMRLAEFEVTEDALVPAGELAWTALLPGVGFRLGGRRRANLMGGPSQARSFRQRTLFPASTSTCKRLRASPPLSLPEPRLILVFARRIGKGFQGPMKRHGFRGLRASHGVSISHRSHGSTGQHQVRPPASSSPCSR